MYRRLDSTLAQKCHQLVPFRCGDEVEVIDVARTVAHTWQLQVTDAGQQMS